MDAYSTDATDLSYSDAAPMLLAASSDLAMIRAERSVVAAGLRIGGRMPIDGAAERIAQQISTSALWIELDCDRGLAMDELLAQVSRDVADGRYAAVVSATAELLDPVAASVGASGVELIIEANDAERAAALAVATAKLEVPLQVSDVATDNNAERLRQLSEEVSRIASTLARLSTGPGAPVRTSEQPPSGDIPPLSADVVRSVIRARRLRARYFRDELFAAAGRNRSASRARFELVHRCSCAGDDSAQVAQDDGQGRAFPTASGPPRWTPSVRRARPRDQPRPAPVLCRRRTDSRNLGGLRRGPVRGTAAPGA
jgi:hypothetical protein